jgi:hypothetical protein
MIYKKTKMIAASLLIVSAVGHVLNSFVPNAYAAPVKKAKPRSAAPRIAGPKSLNTPAVQNYLSRLRGRILKNWMLPDGKNVVVVTAAVTPEGGVSDISTATSKADALAIQSATVAFDKAQPLEHLPPEANSVCKIQITFTSNVDPHGDSNSNVSTRIDMLPEAATPPPETTASPVTPADTSTQTPPQN